MNVWNQLGDRRCFILARVEPKPGGGTNKLPTDPYTGGNISAHDAAQWLTGDEAALWASQWGEGYGVGIVIAEGAGLWCLDIDHCRDGSGWMPHASNFIARFPGAYVETSVSGEGVHVVGSCAVAPVHGTRNATYRCELYTKARFIYLGTQGAGSMLTDCTDALTAFAAQFFPEREHGVGGDDWRDEPVPQWKGPTDDDELIRRALRSRGANAAFNSRASFADLWAGNTEALVRSFPPQGNEAYDGSAADQALANHLAFWTGSHHERVATLLRKSGLARSKHDREDYIRKTVCRACTDQTEWYSGPRTEAPPPGPSIFAEPSAVMHGVAGTPADLLAYVNAAPATVTIDTAGTVTVPAGTAAVPPPPQPTSMLPATQAPHVLTLDGKNKYEASLPNVIHVLAGQKLVLLGFDTFHGQIMISNASGPLDWRPIRDSDMVRLREALERQNFAAVSASMMRDALLVVAERNSYDSAVTWLNGLTWDGTPRIDAFLATYCGAVDDEYTRAVSRYIWTGLPARVFEPGCQLDMVVAFQSRQGTRKSSGLQALAPAPEYFTDGLDLAHDNDDFKRMMQGKIVIEIAELAGLGKAEVEYIKRMITRRTEEWVEKWKTLPTRYPRRNMLFASTNNKRFLPQDDTGQRRWLPVEIEMLDDSLIARDRGQLWAEGAARWRDRKNAGEHGVDWSEAERLAAGRHAKYEQSDPWDKRIETWLDTALEIPGQTLRPAPRTQPLHISEVLEGAIPLDAARIDRKAENRAAGVMRALGYTKRSVRMPGHKHPVERWLAPDFARE